MRKQNRSCSMLATAKQKFNFGAKMHKNSGVKENKRGYSAEGYSLLTSALRPRLFGSSNKDKAKDDALFKFGFSIRIGAVALPLLALGISVAQVSNVSATVQATLTIPDNISVDVNPYASGGFAEGNVGQVEVSTNNQAGYTLSIKSKDGTELKNGDNILNSITTNLTLEQYQSGDYFNTWGFKPDVVNNLANSSYMPGPSTSGIELANTHTNSLAPETFNLAIATKVDKSMAAGNYTNSFVLTATGNEAQYNIAFDVGEGSGGPEEVQHGYIGDDLEVQINSSIPTLEGKDFLGWCTKKPKEDGSCTGVIVQPAGCFPLCKCDLDITLYAMWGSKSGSGGSAGSGAPSGSFSGMSKGTPCESNGYSGTVYAGLCWMNSDLQTKNRNFYQALAECANVGWRLPSYNDFQTLIGNDGLGSGGELYDIGWNGRYYWTSTPSGYVSDAYYLSVVDSGANLAQGSGFNMTVNDYSVRCVAG